MIETERLLLREFTVSDAEFVIGLLAVETKVYHTEIGMCGPKKRPDLDDVDIGLAFLPEFRGSGYAYESAVAVLESAARDHGLTRIVAIVLPDNEPSVRLLERIGMHYEREITMPGDPAVLALYSVNVA